MYACRVAADLGEVAPARAAPRSGPAWWVACWRGFSGMRGQEQSGHGGAWVAAEQKSGGREKRHAARVTPHTSSTDRVDWWWGSQVLASHATQAHGPLNTAHSGVDSPRKSHWWITAKNRERNHKEKEKEESTNKESESESESESE